jgi:hypothetical protein
MVSKAKTSLETARFSKKMRRRHACKISISKKIKRKMTIRKVLIPIKRDALLTRACQSVKADLDLAIRLPSWRMTLR